MPTKRKLKKQIMALENRLSKLEGSYRYDGIIVYLPPEMQTINRTYRLVPLRDIVNMILKELDMDIEIVPAVSEKLKLVSKNTE